MRGCAWFLLFAVITASGCTPAVDLTSGLQVQDVSTGWYDAGIVNGQNKLVPSISFSLKNVSSQKLRTLQVNVLFRRVTEEKEEWGSGFVTAAGSDGLVPGATSPLQVVRSKTGYTAANQSREEMLANSHFVDAVVELFAKYGSTQWKRLGDYPVTRRLITK